MLTNDSKSYLGVQPNGPTEEHVRNFRRSPRSDGPVCYLRLHGRNPKETDYNYSYDPAELEELSGMLLQSTRIGRSPAPAVAER